jgi:transcriptional regulator with XRE-family HTH domain
MHDFYQRVRGVFEQAGSNRHRFCKKHGYSYQTLQAYWNSDRLPPGGVLENLAKEFKISLDFLVLGRNTQEIPVDNPILGRLLRYLVQQDSEELSRIEGALGMYRAMTRTGPAAPRSAEEPAAGSKDLELLTELLTQLARHVKASQMSAEDKEAAQGMLHRLVLNIFGQDLALAEEWAELEEIE